MVSLRTILLLLVFGIDNLLYSLVRPAMVQSHTKWIRLIQFIDRIQLIRPATLGLSTGLVMFLSRGLGFWRRVISKNEWRVSACWLRRFFLGM